MKDRLLRIFNHRAPQITYYAALLLLGGSLVWISYQIISLFQEITQPLPHSTIPLIRIEKENFISEIKTTHLFGDSTVALASTDLGLQLIGIFLNPIQKESRVIIALADKSQKSYKVGDILLNGIKVLKILPNSVILMYREKQVELAFKTRGLELENSPPDGIF